jgi:hypothetical protein
MTLEYKIERFDSVSSGHYKDVEAELNTHGSEGWELDRFLELDGFQYAVFKKQK